MTASQPTPPGTGQPVDVRPMLVVHQALLREFHMTGWAVASALPWDHERVVVLNGHLTFLLDLLHHHHAGEDKLLWPKLLSRAPADTVPIVDLMQAQHERLATLMTQCRAAAGDWQADAAQADAAPAARDQLAGLRDRLAGLLIELHERLAEHLAYEERDVLPIAAVHLSEPEWRQFGEEAVQAIPRSQLPLVFGMFAREGDPEVLRIMLQEAPLLPRMLMPKLGPRAYAKHARQIYGPVQP
jgi:hypothetical protein